MSASMPPSSQAGRFAAATTLWSPSPCVRWSERERGRRLRAVVYSQAGGPDEVRVAVQVSGVNPTDWKARRRSGADAQLPFPEVVPNQDGAGTIDAVGDGVDPSRVGERVWLWEAAWQRADGTAQEYVVLPERQAVRLPDGISFDVGATLGIPAL